MLACVSEPRTCSSSTLPPATTTLDQTSPTMRLSHRPKVSILPTMRDSPGRWWFILASIVVVALAVLIPRTVANGPYRCAPAYPAADGCPAD
jgi:hypothetical protein